MIVALATQNQLRRRAYLRCFATIQQEVIGLSYHQAVSLRINDNFMIKHLVFGAGLIGCYLGAVLRACKADSDTVTLLTRPRMLEHLASGMSLSDYQNNHIKLETIDAVSEVKGSETYYDFIWLTVKCISVAEAVKDLRQCVGPDTIIICCQNGLGSERIITNAFPTNTVLRAMVPFNVIVESNNHFHRGSEGHLTIESSRHNDRIKLSLTAQNVNSGDANALLPLAFTSEMTAMQWAKLQLNLGNSVNALANIPVKSMLEQRGFRLVIAAMMKELLAVTDNMGVRLPKVTTVPAHWIPRVLSLPDFIFKRVASKMLAIDPTVRTSMWWDLQQGRQTEIDFLNGVVVENAKENGIPSQVNQSIIERVKRVELQSLAERQSYSAAQLACELGIIKSEHK